MKILFDVDGVLLEGGQARRKPWADCLERDLGVDPARFDAAFFARPSPGRPSLMERCLKGEIDLKQTLSEVLPELGCTGDADDFVAYWFENDTEVNPEMLGLVERLARHDGVELYLATGQEHHRAAYLWNVLDFQRHFRAMFYSARLGHLKTEPGFFQAIGRELGLQPGPGSGSGPGPGEADPPIFFDDKPEVVCLARRAGWDARVVASAADVRSHPRVRPLLGR